MIRSSVWMTAVCRIAVAVVAVTVLTTTANAQNVREKTIMRVFWQDAVSQKLSYANLTASSRWNLRRGWVSGFPSLDPSTQSLGDMVTAAGQVFVSVTADSDTAAGGWVCLDSGAFEEPHGNHTHWRYSRTPKVRQSELAAGRGQTAGLILHNGTVAHADSTGTCTLLTPAQMKFGGDRGIRKLSLPVPARFCMLDGGQLFAAGGTAQSITINRYDISQGVRRSSGEEFAGTALFDVAQNLGRTFVACDGRINRSHASPAGAGSTLLESSAPFQHLTSCEDWVLSTSGAAQQTRLCLIKATDEGREMLQLPIPGPMGTRPGAPAATLSLGKRFAFVIHQASAADTTVQEQLVMILLDPNKDKDFSDAKIHTTIDLGSHLPAQAGTSDICFDAYGRYAVISSPATGVLSVVSLSKKSVVARFKVGGAPGRIVGVGAAEHFH